MSKRVKILTIDIGTGTQDIYLYDSRQDIENGFKLILPSPTMIIYRRLQQATAQRQPVFLTGRLMGGGPSTWGAEGHLNAGLPVFATPAAALSFNDDLFTVEQMGVKIISEDEGNSLSSETCRIELGDFNFLIIQKVFQEFGVQLNDLAAVAVAVFDHGAAPIDVSDRQFRFDYLDRRIRQENRLSAFAYLAAGIPSSLTRLQAVADSASNLSCSLIVMDTAPAAVLGATFDPFVQDQPRKIIANIGNFHTLAFRLGPEGIEGVFEHHTGLLNQLSLENLLISFANGNLSHADVFNHHGHGALVYSHQPLPLRQSSLDLIITGPRRNILEGSSLRPYFAAPFGDMMIAGCFGLLAATADLLPDYQAEILSSLSGKGGSGTPPWEISEPVS
jgi:uncharacterized protein (DUF1786 family)